MGKSAEGTRTDLREAEGNEVSVPCKFCHVLPEYGHFDWCKVNRPPSADEIARAVIDENDRSVGYDGPSEKLAAMCRAYLGLESREKADAH